MNEKDDLHPIFVIVLVTLIEVLGIGVFGWLAVDNVGRDWDAFAICVVGVVLLVMLLGAFYWRVWDESREEEG
jgi:membrane protein DedA with SNARE-associated domain